jgi:thiamine biosynthesis lipoprotein
MKQLSLFLSFLFLLNISCKQKAQYQSVYFEGDALGTTYHIKAFKTNQSKEVRKKDIDSVITAINNSLSTYQPNSLISRINKGEVLKLDQQFVDVYKAAKKIYQETGGLYDPTIGILVNAWGFGPTEKIKGIEKDSTIVDSLKRFVGYNFLSIDDNGFLNKTYPQVYIDYNSIAKGYAIDRVGKMLENKGFDNYIVEIGGEVLAKGKNLQKDKAWLVAIDNPDRAHGSKFISKIALNNQAIATSGNYRKYFVDEATGRKYVHTLNPKTGYPIQRHILSASVIAENCTLADGYATAFMVLGFKPAKRFLEKHPELQAFLVYSDDKGQIKTYKTPKVHIIK